MRHYPRYCGLTSCSCCVQGCGPGYSCQLGMCLVQHPGRGVTGQEEVFPCQASLECPLNMACNKVSGNSPLQPLVGVVFSTSGPYKNFIIDTLTLSNHRSLSCLVHFSYYLTLTIPYFIFRCELKLKLLEYTSYYHVLFRM